MNKINGLRTISKTILISIAGYTLTIPVNIAGYNLTISYSNAINQSYGTEWHLIQVFSSVPQSYRT